MGCLILYRVSSSFHISINSMVSLWVHSLMSLLLFLFDIRLLLEGSWLLVLGFLQYYQTFLQCFFVKFHFLLLQTHVFLFQFYKKIDTISRISQCGMSCKNVVLFCHVSMLWTLVDLFYTKRLFSQQTAFFQIILPEIRTEGVLSPRNLAVLVQ